MAKPKKTKQPAAPPPAPAAEASAPSGIHRIEQPLAAGVLEAVTTVYLATAPILFFCGWLRWYIALPLVLAYAATMGWSAWRAYVWARDERLFTVERRAPSNVQLGCTIIGILVFVPVAAASAGMGGMSFQFSDYAMYDANLRLLIEADWPPGLVTEHQQVRNELPGTYYWAYWLLPALVGKMLGWSAAYFSWFLWNCFGLTLALVWFLRLLDTYKLRFAILFLFFGGLDLIGYVLTSPWPGESESPLYDYATGTFWWSIGPGWMDYWTVNFSLLTEGGDGVMDRGFYRFFSHLSFLFDGPMHVLPGWVIILMVLHDVWRRDTVERAFLVTSILPLCSIFVALGMLPVLALSLWHTRAKQLLTIGNVLVGPLLVAVFYLFYQGIETAFPNNWIWEYEDLVQTWPFLLTHFLSEFGVYLFALPVLAANGYRPGRAWLLVAILMFLIAPVYRFGHYNDFSSKVLIPSQVIFLACICMFLLRPEGKRALLRSRVLTVMIVVGCWSASGILLRAVEFGFGFHPPLQEQVRHAPEVLPSAPLATIDISNNTFFWKWLAGSVDYLDPEPIEPVLIFDFTAQDLKPYQWISFSEEFEFTDQGLVIVTEGDQPLFRRDNLGLDTDMVGTIFIEHEIESLDDGGDVPRYVIVLQWASPRDIARLGSNWPFHRWRSAALHPHRDSVKTNSYWRGEVKDLAVYLDMLGGEPNDRYRVTVKRVIFLER